MRILCLTPHPYAGASSRYRVMQYVPQLEAAGIRCTVSPFMVNAFYAIVYQQGCWFRKLLYFFVGTMRRCWDVLRCRRYDVVFIHLEAFPIGPPMIEWLIRLCGVPIVFDLDDAIFLRPTRSAHPLLQWLRMPSKLPMILRWSRYVITCNDYLADYVRQYNAYVHMIPTCVDTLQFTVSPARTPRVRPLVGWVGSHSTAPYLDLLRPMLQRLAQSCAFDFKVVGLRQPFAVPGVHVIQEPWTLARDVAVFQELDIGVYPLPTEEWVLGKTGFKTVQYMAVGVPCVASRVGRNTEIIEDRVNGFLASTEDEWCESIERLLRDSALRERIGTAGRATVEARFTTARYVNQYVALFRDTVSGANPMHGQTNTDMQSERQVSHA
jgi:L-malate glycosyltransferase